MPQMQQELLRERKKMTIEEVKAALRPYNLKRVADDTGMEYKAIWRFATGRTKSPSWEIVTRLAAYLQGGK